MINAAQTCHCVG